MGSTTATDISQLDIPLKQQIEIHLTSNFYPPIPSFMADTCIHAIELYWDGENDRLISLPNGVTYKNQDSAPVWAIIEQHKLEPWIQDDYDEAEFFQEDH